jgi:tetratricopeptide (TPR) repeat protein
MYLRTPKRYRPGRHRHLQIISRRTLGKLLLIALVALAGWLVWNHQAEFRTWVLPRIENIAENVQTQVAVQPTPTATPDLAAAQVGCATAYRQGDLEESIKQCSFLADNSPNDVTLHYQVAHMLIITSNLGKDTEKLDLALQYAEETINAAPEAPYGWAIRAMALDWRGDYGAALASALHAKALDEKFGPTYAFLGEIYHDLGQDDVALGYLNQAIQLDTGGLAVADAFRNEGKLYSDQGFWEDALDPYEAALKQAPNYAYIAIELANNYIALERYDEAIAVLSNALSLNPTDPGIYFTIADAYTRNGNKEKAYEYYHRCLDSTPDDIPCLSYLGGLLWSDGDYVMAITNLERAIQLGSTDSLDYLQLGLSYAAQGRCDLATPYLQQGYQMTLEEENAGRQASFTNALQSCGVLVSQPVPSPTPTPGPE